MKKSIIYFLLVVPFYKCGVVDNQKNNKLSNYKYVEESLDAFLKKIVQFDSLEIEYVNGSFKDTSIESKCCYIHKTNIKYGHYFMEVQASILKEENEYTEIFLKVNGKKVKNFSDKEGMLDIYFDDYLESEYPIFKTREGFEFYILKGTSPNGVGRLSKIKYGFLILKDNKNFKCLKITTFGLPNDFYWGYNKTTNKLVYLTVISEDVENDSVEHIYTIHPEYLNINKLELEPILDKNGSEIIIKVATPNINDISRYRVISNSFQE
ncbi:MAG: hypothetical protein ACOYMA_18460 [Bacteroidia bacterium]